MASSFQSPLVEDVGARVVAALGEPGARELLDVLERSDADRAALIGRLQAGDDARWLAEMLMDLEDDVGEIARLRLIDALRALTQATRALLGGGLYEAAIRQDDPSASLTR